MAKARPDFLCIGAQKAGTTWLYSMLKQNKSVFLPPIKEIHFLDSIYVDGHDKWIEASFAKRSKTLSLKPGYFKYFKRLRALDRTTDAWYAAVFEHPKAEGRITGEITPAYSILPTEGIERARAINPDMKLIFIIRDPVDRALSQLRMVAGRRKWAAGVGEEVLGQKKLMQGILQRSAYSQNIARWEAVFPAAQILYQPYKRIRPEPEAVMREVETFIGADAGTYTGLGSDVHKSAPAVIAPGVVEALTKKLANERVWLRERFGADYVTG